MSLAHSAARGWTIVPSPPLRTGGAGSALLGSFIVSPNDVWAVGFSPQTASLNTKRTLTEHWNGFSWTVVPSPNVVQNGYNQFNAVAASSADDVWAVGESGYPSSAPDRTLIVHWNGARWRLVPSPSPGDYLGNDIYAVAAISPRDAWAVGFYESGAFGATGGALTMHWNGERWSVVNNPGRSQSMRSATAIRSDDVWAVGSGILHYDGSAWRSVRFPVPNFANFDGVLFLGVSATSSSDVWCAGIAYQKTMDGGRATYNVVEHWNGSAWSVVPDAGGDGLFSVRAVSRNLAWAVGNTGEIERWNGSIWSFVQNPHGGIPGAFFGIAAITPSGAWAVGDAYTAAGEPRTFIERYTQ